MTYREPVWYTNGYFPEVFMNVEFVYIDKDKDELISNGYYTPVNGGSFYNAEGIKIDKSEVIRWRPYAYIAD